jgi:predicted transcriptional regulator
MFPGTRIDIVSRILEAANSGATRTKILDVTFLSHIQLMEYLSMLVDNGLLDYELEEQFFRTTESGHRFLQTYAIG